MSRTKEYRPWTPEQCFLLPPSPMDWLPEGHLAYFVLELVRELDASAIEDKIQGKEARGVRPYSPRMMTALLLYAYCVGVFSSRKIERATYSEQLADELSPPHDDDADGGAAATSLPNHRVPTTPQGEPRGKPQRNFTDPDSCIMVRNGVFLQAYNAQAAVSESQVIVAHGVTNQPSDHEHLVPMLERMREHVGCLPEVLTADAGFLSQRNVEYCESNGVDAYIAVRRKEDEGAELGRLPMSQAHEVRWRMHQKVRSAQGREIYRRRKLIAEPVFGQIKQALGFRQFSLRGLTKVAAEWAIVCLCHNLLKLYRAVGSMTALAN